MPYIIIKAEDTGRMMRSLTMKVQVQFEGSYYRSGKYLQKMEDLRKRLEAVVKEYFDECCSEDCTNHEFNVFHSKNLFEKE